MRTFKLLLLLFPGLLLAQSIPNGTITQGQVWTPSQWNTAWQSKLDFLPIAPGTVIGNPSNSTALPGAHPITSFTGQSLALSSVSGIDCTGVSDSRAGVVSAIATANAANQTLVIDCPVYLAIGTDYTKSIFIPTGANFQFTGSGVLIIDNIEVPAFVVSGSHDITWKDSQIEYVGNFGLVAINDLLPGPLTAFNKWASTTLANYMIANNGNTFSSNGIPSNCDPTSQASIFFISGNSYRINLVGKSRMYVPDDAAAGSFIPQILTSCPNWNAGVAVTGSTVPTTANTSIPNNIVVSGWTFDGFLMGFTGEWTQGTISNNIALRYSDLQDGSGGTVTFNAGLSSGTTSATLAAPWAYLSGTYALTLSNSQLVYVAMTNGSAGTGVFFSYISWTTNFSVGATNGTLSAVWPYATGTYPVTFIDGETRSVAFTNGLTSTGGWTALTGSSYSYTNVVVGASANVTATATSGNPGGIGNWFSPPHFIYMDSGSSPNWQVQTEIRHITDFGLYTGVATRRSTGSGYLESLKFEPANGSVVDGYISLRPDGGLDLLSRGNSGGQVNNVYAAFDSSITTANSGIPFCGMGFDGPFPYSQLSMNNITLIDTASVPTCMPFAGIFTSSGGVTSSDVSITNLKEFSKDWPSGATYIPGFVMVGNHMNLQAEIHLAASNSTQIRRGAIANGGVRSSNVNVDVTVFGWRQFDAIFTGAFSIGATTGTLSTNWTPVSGTYFVRFSDGETRYVSFTNGSTAVGSWTALTGAPTAKTVAGGSLTNSYNNYKNLMALTFGGTGFNNHAHVLDVDNGWEGTLNNGITTESWTQMWTGTPTGATYTTPITFPSTMAIDMAAPRIGTNLDTSNGLTTYGVGCTGVPTAILSAQLATTAFIPVPTFAPTTACGANAILLTPTAGAFGTTGLLQLSVRGSQMIGAN